MFPTKYREVGQYPGSSEKPIASSSVIRCDRK